MGWEDWIGLAAFIGLVAMFFIPTRPTCWHCDKINREVRIRCGWARHHDHAACAEEWRQNLADCAEKERQRDLRERRENARMVAEELHRLMKEQNDDNLYRCGSCGDWFPPPADEVCPKCREDA